MVKASGTRPNKSFAFDEQTLANLVRLSEYWHLSQTKVIAYCLQEFAALETERLELEEQRRVIEAHENELQGIQQSLDEIKRMVANPVYVPATASEPAANPGSARPLAGAIALAMPVFDDQDTIVIRRDESSGETATNNFHASMMGLMNARFEDESDKDAP